MVYIDIDALRPDHLGCYGYHRATSPNIDALASEAMVLDRCYTSDSPCLPSRTALFSGRFGLHTGVVNNGGPTGRLRDGEWEGLVSLPAVLSRAGYHTVTFTTFAQRHHAWFFYAGWDEIHKHCNGNGMETADQVNTAVLPWLRSNTDRDRFFLHINYWDPHTPYRTPTAFGEPFANAAPPDWPTDEAIIGHRQSYGPFSAQDLPVRRGAYPRQPSANSIATRDDFRKYIDGYDTGICYADAHVGQVLAELQRSPLWAETAVIISADHGENQGELNIYGDHRTADHPTCHVPLIVHWPGVTHSGHNDRLVYQLDLSPTICELLGISSPGRWDGRSFTSALRGTTFSGRPYLVFGHGASSCQRAVLCDDWLLIRTYHDGYHPFPPVMLFNLRQDVYETCSQTIARPEVVDRLSRLMEEWWQAEVSQVECGPDPLLEVLQQGGPLHVRHLLPDYLGHLRDTGRAWAADALVARQRAGRTVTEGEARAP